MSNARRELAVEADVDPCTEYRRCANELEEMAAGSGGRRFAQIGLDWLLCLAGSGSLSSVATS